MSFVVKVSAKNGEIRRFALPSSITWAEFSDSLTKLNIFSASDNLRYRDEEGDAITISNDADLQEGIRVFAKSGAPIWRLFISPNTPSKKEECKKPDLKAKSPLFSIVEQFISNSGLESLIDQVRAKFSEEKLGKDFDTNFVHPAVCDACDAQIVGIRWKCTNRFDTDLCNTCKEEGTNPLCKYDYVKIEGRRVPAACGLHREGPKAQPQKAKLTVVHPAYCDACDEQIVGIRWKCLDLEDTDLCEKCMLAGEHPLCRHEYVEIDKVDDEACDWEPTIIFVDGDEVDGEEEEEDVDEEEELDEEVDEDVDEEEVDEDEEETVDDAQRIPEEKSADETAIEEKSPVIESSSSVPVLETKEEVKEEKEEPFASKLNLLHQFGFSDRQKNISALVQAKGDIAAAVNQLLL